jgi:hypothetical protein
MSFQKPAACRDASPYTVYRTEPLPRLFPPSLDSLPQSTYNSTTLSDPQALLLQRWDNLSPHISRLPLSCDVVITLNRSLDQVEVVLRGVAVDGGGNKAGKADDSGLSGLVKSGAYTGALDETTAMPPNTPEHRKGKMSRKVHQGNGYLLIRMTQAIELLRYRQQEFKVRNFIAGRGHAKMSMSASP